VNHTEIIITNILQTRTAFGVRADNSEAVFVPGKVSVEANIKIGQSVKALLIPNPNMPEKTPWMAVFIGEPSDTDPLDAEIKADLERGPATAREVAASLNRPIDLIGRKLREMAQLGGLVQDTVYALSADDLMTEEDA